MLGIGIDENTAIVVRGDNFEVIGSSLVLTHDQHRQLDHDGPAPFRTVDGFFYVRAQKRRDVRPENS